MAAWPAVWKYPRSACPINLDHTLGELQQPFPLPAAHIILMKDNRGRVDESADNGKGSSFLAYCAEVSRLIRPLLTKPG